MTQHIKGIGGAACLAAAICFAGSAVAQPTVPVDSVQASVLSDSVPIAGVDIPDDEASELRGGRWAVVSYKVGRKIGYKVYSCATTASCKAKGAKIVKDIGGAVILQIAVDLVKTAACRKLKLRC